MMVINSEANENTSNDNNSPETTVPQKKSLRFRLTFILIFAPLVPAAFMMFGLYFILRNYLLTENANVTVIIATLTAIIIAVFLVTVFINIYAIKIYVTSPIMALVERVSKFHTIMNSSHPLEQDQAADDSLDAIKRSVADFRTIEGMANRIRHLETEIDKIYYDPLTGIYNRRYLDEYFGRIMYSLSRSSGVLSVLMVDIDHFKNYNDLYGHLQGDECLKMITKTILESIVRADDFVVRYGGEEFAVILPNTDKTGALRIAETLLKKMQTLGIPHESSPVADYVTVSIGVTTGIIKHTHTAEDFLQRADEMLYKSKQNGRNMCYYCDLE